MILTIWVYYKRLLRRSKVQLPGKCRVKARYLLLVVELPVGVGRAPGNALVGFGENVVDGVLLQITAIDHVAQLLDQPASGFVAERVVAWNGEERRMKLICLSF